MFYYCSVADSGGGFFGSAEPPFYRFECTRRRPRASAQAQSKHSWTAEPHLFKILDLPLMLHCPVVSCRETILAVR